MSQAKVLRIGLQQKSLTFFLGYCGLDAFEFFENLYRHGIKNCAHAVTPSAASVPVVLAGTGAETPIMKSAAFSALPAAYITRSASALIAAAQFRRASLVTVSCEARKTTWKDRSLTESICQEKDVMEKVH
jgi:hypothetical protein